MSFIDLAGVHVESTVWFDHSKPEPSHHQKCAEALHSGESFRTEALFSHQAIYYKASLLE